MKKHLYQLSFPCLIYLLFTGILLTSATALGQAEETISTIDSIESGDTAKPAGINTTIEHHEVVNVTTRKWNPLTRLWNPPFLPGEPNAPATGSNCTNSDFSQGTFNLWKGCNGKWCDASGPGQTRCSNPFTPYNLPCNNAGMPWANTNPGTGHFAIIAAPGSADAFVPAINSIFPGEPYTCLIGNHVISAGGGYVDQLKYEMTMGADNQFFIYRYAVVLANIADVTHNTADKRPRFTIEIKDHTTGALLDPTCGFFDVYPGDGTPGWETTTWGSGTNMQTLQYKNWNTVGIDLSGMTVAGQTIDVVFTVHGCSFTAHTGYAYISATCGAMTVEFAGCEGSGQITFTGPPGFQTYEWQGPYCPSCADPPPIYTGQIVTITTAQGAVSGNVFELNLTAANGCSVQHVQQIVGFTSVNPAFSSTVMCANNVSTFTDNSVSSNATQPVINRKWQFDAAGAWTALTTNPVITYTYLTPGPHDVTVESYSLDGCMGTITHTVNVDPAPAISNVTTTNTICSGESPAFALLFSPGTDATWTSSITTGTGTITHNPASQSGTVINDVIVNTGTVNAIATYTVTPHGGGCNGAPTTFTVTVKPTPHLTNTPHAPVCSGSTFNVTLVPDVTGGDFTWTASCLPLGAVTGFTNPQATNTTTINDLLTNTTTSPATVTYHMTPHANGCDGLPVNYTVTVNPTPHLTNTAPSPICSGATFNVALAPDVTGGNFTWTASSLPAGAVTGFTSPQVVNTTTISDLLTNTTVAPATVTYRITPHANGCNGLPTDFTVTVNPTPHLNNSAPSPICSGATFNVALAPDVTGGDFTWTATCLPIGAVTGFTSPQVTNTITINDVLTNLTTAPATVTYHITPHANGCAGVLANYTVTVNPTPHLNNSAPSPICSGATFNVALAPDVTGGNFTWTASCLPAGAVTGFTNPQITNTTTISDPLINTTTAPATVTYHITPHANGCDGVPTDYTVTVNPTPHLNNTAPLPICSGATFNVALTPDVTGGDFTWTASCLPIGAVTGFTNPQVTNTTTINDLLINTTAAPATVTYHITPHAIGCDGVPTNFTVTVNPTPHLNNSAPSPICSGATFNVALAPDVTGGNFTWTASCLPAGAVTGFTDPQVTNTTTISDVLTNTTTAPATVTYHLTPHANGCDGVPADFTVTVNPTPHLTNSAPLPICSGATFNVALAPDVTGGDFTWTATCLPVGSVTGFTNPQVMNTITINDVLTNLTTAPATVTYHITPHANGCAGVLANYTVTVNPTPHLTNTAPLPICSGATFNVALAPDVTGGDFTWTASCIPLGAVTGFTDPQVASTTTISDVLTNPTTAPATVTYHITPHANGCDGLPTDFTVTVNPTPHLTNSAPLPICSEATFNVALAPDVTGGNFTWTASCLPAGAVTGFTNPQVTNTTTISDLLTNTTTAPATVTYHITPHANGCDGLPTNFTVTVNPTTHLLNTAPSPICSGATFNVALAPDVTGGDFTWTASCLPIGAVSGFTNPQVTNTTTISDVLTNPTTAPATVTYHITPHANGCDGVPTDFTVTVNPTPHLANMAPLPICSGATFNVALAPDVTGGDFTWTSSCLPIGAVIGFTNPQLTNTTTISDLLTNTTTAPATVTYHILPHANGCDGVPADFTVTVNPTPHLTNTAPLPICSEATFNVALAPDVTGGDFTWTASCLPIGAVTGFTNPQVVNTTIISDRLTNTTTAPATVTYHITPHANGCDGVPTNFTVTVNPTPHLTNTAPLPICSGATFNVALAPDVTGGDFTWTASCLPAGAVSGFTNPQLTNTTTISDVLTNPTTAPATVTYHILPHANGCDGVRTDFTVTVNPTPHLTNTAPLPICSEATFNVALAPDVTGGDFTWTASCLPIGAVTGFTNPQVINTTTISDVLTNTTTAPATVTYHITPHANGCDGLPTNYTVTVNPTPHLTNTAPSPICSGATFNVALAPDVTGGNFTWTASCLPAGSVTGFTNPQVTNTTTISDLLTNTTSAPATVTYHIIPHANGCDGVPSNFIVTVNPTPHLTNTAPLPICSGATFNVALAPDVTGGNFTWTASCLPAGAVTGFTNPQVTNTTTINDPLTNITTAPATVTYHITPHANGCDGLPTNFTVTVNPTPHLLNTAPSPICSGATFNVALAPDVTGGNFTWTASCLPAGAVTGFTNPQLTNTTTISDVLTNSINTIATVTYHITPHANGCSGPVTSFSVNVNPVPIISCSIDQSICSGTGTTAIILNSTVSLTNFSWSATCPVGSVNPCPVTPGTANPIPSVTFMNVTNTPQQVTYTINSSFDGCPGTTATHVVTINPSPTVTNWPLEQTICSGGTSSQINLASSVIGTTFSWSASTASPITGFTTTGSAIIPIQNLFIPPGNTGFVTYHIIPSFSGGATCPGAPTDYKINVNPLPTPLISGSTLVCELQPTVTYTTPSVPGHSYSWNVTGAASISNENTNAVTVTWGPYTVSPGTLTVTETIDATACLQTTSVYSVILQQRPIPTLTGPQTVCDGSPGKIYQTEPSMSNYTWAINGGSITAGGGTGSPTATVTWNTPGSQWIQVNYVNSLGCPGFPAKQIPVFVNQLPNTTISEGTGPNCESASHIYNVPIDPLCSYVWSVLPLGRGNVVSGQGTGSITIDWQTFGSATISVTGTNNTTTCVSSSSHVLTIHPKPLPSFVACFDLNTTPNARKFTLRGASPILPVQGVFTGNSRINYNILTGNYEFDPFGASVGGYPVIYTFTNNYGCVNSTPAVTINVQNNPFSCGGMLTDVRDGKQYKTSNVGGRCWMTENLAYGTVLNPQSKPQTDNCINEKYCLNTDPACSQYGGLYQWDELMRYASTSADQGICPPEWHIPSEAEWQSLINNISVSVTPPADALAGSFLKDPLLNPGFFALFEGLYYINNTWSFTSGTLTATMYWTSTANGPERATARSVNVITPSVSRYMGSRGNAFSVRCIKD